MDIELLQQKFGRLGTRVHITEVVGRSRRGAGIDIRADTRGEYFDIRVELGNNATQRRRVCARARLAPGSQDDCARRLVSRVDEHRE
jgi:hypothetical protein